MKKFFAIYTTLTLIDKPVWFDKFRKEYDEFLYGAHITLTQPCYVDNSQVAELKEIVSKFFKNNKLDSTELTFDKLFLDRQDEEGDGCIMVEAEAMCCEELLNFQKKLNLLLKNYKDYTETKYKGYEENFRPHITIGSNLDGSKFTEAVDNLPENITIRATFPEAILAIVNDKSPEERNNPNNLTYFKLQ